MFSEEFDINKLKTVESKNFITLSQLNFQDVSRSQAIFSENIQTSEDLASSLPRPNKIPYFYSHTTKSPMKPKPNPESSINSARSEITHLQFAKEFESNKKITQIEPKRLDITQELDNSALDQIETPDISYRADPKPLGSKKDSELEQQINSTEKKLTKIMFDVFILLLVFLAHVIVIALITGFLSFYRFESNSLRYLDNIFNGIFLGVISMALNLDQIFKQYIGSDKKKVLLRMSCPYIMILACSIIICIFLDMNFAKHNEYRVIAIQIFALIAASLIYTTYVYMIKKIYKKGQNETITMNQLFLKIKNVILTQLMIIYPFCQLMISVVYGRWFHEITELNISEWAIFGLCMTYPISIGISKWIMEKKAKKTELKMKFYIEYISLAFAALPFRTLYFDISEYERLAIVLFTKFFYKISYYVIVAMKARDIKSFIDNFFTKIRRKVGKRGSVVIGKLANNVIDIDPSSQIDVEIKSISPIAADFGMKFILLMFSDIFSTLAMMIIVSLFNKLKPGMFGTDAAIRYYVQSSAIDLGLDVIFLFVVTWIWRRSSSDLKKIDLFEVGKLFFKRYYLVFVASNFNLFHTLFYILSSLLTLS